MAQSDRPATGPSSPLESNAAQIDRFKELARELGCDEDEAAFDEKLNALAQQKPKDQKANNSEGSR